MNPLITTEGVKQRIATGNRRKTPMSAGERVRAEITGHEGSPENKNPATLMKPARGFRLDSGLLKGHLLNNPRATPAARAKGIANNAI